MAKKIEADKSEFQKKVKNILDQSSFLKDRIKPMGGELSILGQDSAAREAELSEFNQNLENRSKQLNSTHDQLFRLMEQGSRLEAENGALKAEILEIKRCHKAEIENLEKKRKSEVANAAAASSDGYGKMMVQLLNEERLRWREKFQPNKDETGKGANDGDQ